MAFIGEPWPMKRTGIRAETGDTAVLDMTELLTEGTVGEGDDEADDEAKDDRRHPSSSAPPAARPGGIAPRKRLRVRDMAFGRVKTIMGCRRGRFVPYPTAYTKRPVRSPRQPAPARRG